MNQSQRSQRHNNPHNDDSCAYPKGAASTSHLPTYKTHTTTLATSNTFRTNKENEQHIDLTKSSQLSLAKSDNLRRIQISLKSSSSSVGLGMDKSLLDKSNIVLNTSSLTLSKSNLHEEFQIKSRALGNHYTVLCELFKRQYEAAINCLSSPKALSIESMIQVLNMMGYLQQPIIHQQDLKLVRMAHYLLNGRPTYDIKPQNLFSFLLIVSRIEIPSPFNNYDELSKKQPGRIDMEGNIYFSSVDQQKIRETYKKLWDNRLENRESKKRTNEYAVTFKEALREYQIDLNKIRECREQQRVSIQDTHKFDKISSKEKIIREERRKKSEEMKNCTFKPKILRDAKMTDREGTDRCQQLFNLARKRTLSNVSKTQLSTSEERERRELEQCTFKPKQTPFRLSIRTPKVKNSEKAIKRLAQGRARRQNETTLIERGYPKDVTWTKFMQSCKGSKNQSSNVTRRSSPRKPIITIDIRLCETTQQALEVFEGDSLENITCKVLVKNRLHYEYYNKLIRLIAEALRNAEAVVVKDGFVYSAS